MQIFSYSSNFYMQVKTYQYSCGVNWNAFIFPVWLFKSSGQKFQVTCRNKNFTTKFTQQFKQCPVLPTNVIYHKKGCSSHLMPHQQLELLMTKLPFSIFTFVFEIFLLYFLMVFLLSSVECYAVQYHTIINWTNVYILLHNAVYYYYTDLIGDGSKFESVYFWKYMYGPNTHMVWNMYITLNIGEFFVMSSVTRDLVLVGKNPLSGMGINFKS